MKAMRCPACLLVAVVLLAAAPVVSAQSLAAVAKEEKARRQTVKDAGKTFTNKDLKQTPPSQVVSSGPGVSKEDAAAADSDNKTEPADANEKNANEKNIAKDADKSEGKKAEAGKSAVPVKDEAYWHGRITECREQLDRDQLLAEALQTRINSLTTDFVNRDDPAQRAVIATDREKALAELQKMQKAVEDDLKAVASVEEEARRAGVPAGWLR